MSGARVANTAADGSGNGASSSTTPSRRSEDARAGASCELTDANFETLLVTSLLELLPTDSPPLRSTERLVLVLVLRGLGGLARSVLAVELAGLPLGVCAAR